MEEFYTIYVVDDHKTLQGIVSIKDIIKARGEAKVRDLVQPILCT
jgi:magnesium transporter